MLAQKAIPGTGAINQSMGGSAGESFMTINRAQGITQDCAPVSEHGAVYFGQQTTLQQMPAKAMHFIDH